MEIEQNKVTENTSDSVMEFNRHHFVIFDPEIKVIVDVPIVGDVKKSVLQSVVLNIDDEVVIDLTSRLTDEEKAAIILLTA